MTSPPSSWMVCALCGIPEIGQQNNMNVITRIQKTIQKQFGTRDFKWRSLCTSQITLAATKALLQEAAQHLAQSTAQKPNSVFIYFNGHGVQKKDRDGDETDGLDECWVLAGGGLFLDDELTDMFSKAPPSSKFVIVSDSCSSGTMLDVCRWKSQQKATWISVGSCKDNEDALTCSEGGVFTSWGFLAALEQIQQPTLGSLKQFLHSNLELGTQHFTCISNANDTLNIFA